jgi:hypothetical protein
MKSATSGHHFTMNDGQVTVGTILRGGRDYRALASGGTWLGTFPTLKEAARAISRSQGARA